MLGRYLRLLGLQLRMSLTLGAQYRWDFLLDGAMSIVWTGLAVVPLYVAFHERPAVAGWTFEQSLVVVGWFTLLKGILDGGVNPSLVVVVDHIRKGTLDFVLMKPADPQFLVSTAKFEPWKGVDALASAALFAWACVLLGRAPTAGQIALGVALLLAATSVLYSLWILVVSAAFWVIRLDNLSYLLNVLFDFGRWPVSLFKGVVRLLFTFVIPVAIMTTFPAQALLGSLPARTAVLSLLGSAVFTLLARRVWQRAIGRYTSASS
jgi:ABC-2 type transport system permease protein